MVLHWRKGFCTILSLMLVFMLATCGGKSDKKEEAKKEEKEEATADSANAEAKKKEDEDKKKQEKAVPVRVVSADTGVISSYLLFSSVVESEEQVEVYPLGSGMVISVNVEEGDYVRNDDVLVQLDDEELRLLEEKAAINARKVKHDFERVEDMHAKELLSQEEHENAKYQLELAQIEWENAKLALDRTKIRAPIPGIIAQRDVKLGDRVGPNTQLFSIVNPESLVAKVFVPSKELGNVKTDQKVVISSDFVPGKEYQGWVKRISPVVDPQSGTLKVTVGIKGDTNLLRVGIFVNVHIVIAVHKDAILIPKTALIYDGDQRYAFVIQDTVATKTLLDIGFSDRDNVEILSGIEEGAQVIVVGQEGLKDKARIKIVTEDLLPEEEEEASSG